MNVEDDLQGAIAALNQGEAARAREMFARVIASGRSDSPVLLALSRACAAVGDLPGQIAALDRVLSVEPRNLRALIWKGDYLANAGDSRAATSHYLMALKWAQQQKQLSQDLIAELRRAREVVDRYSKQYQSHILSQMASKGFSPERSSPRFSESLDIVLGRKRAYFQEPKYYYFPGLPQIQFYDRSAFPWLDVIEQATADIREELLAVLQQPNSFAPYVQGDASRPRKDQAGMLNNPAWSAFYLRKNGEIIQENAARCPRTMVALQDAPLAVVPNRSPSILFSLMQAGAHIPPHNGLVNTRLICHLPLIVPQGCRFRVGNEVRSWQEGKAWLFDDTIEHEAWNDSSQTRVILLFDVWRPELTREEQELVTSLFESIDAHDGRKPDWSI